MPDYNTLNNLHTPIPVHDEPLFSNSTPWWHNLGQRGHMFWLKGAAMATAATCVLFLLVHMSAPVDEEQLLKIGEPMKDDKTMEAVSVINIGTKESGIIGILRFTQSALDGPVHIHGNISGLPPNSVHGFHVHESGDTSNLEKPCDSVGNHLNPEKKLHGGPDDEIRHMGDLGNVEADANGVGVVDRSYAKITLNGPNSIVGRAIMVHQLRDDLGKGVGGLSLQNGNAGPRIGCGLIGVINK